jgi:hypothetical protein
MLELQKLRKDINWLIEQIKCLMNKSDLTTALSATEWSTNHSLVEGNPYNKEAFTWYNGHIYKSLVDDNQYPPTNATYWTDLGEGHQLLEEQSDWNATTGRAFIRNKPSFVEEAPNDGSQYVRKNEVWDKLTTYSAVNPVSTNNVAGGFPLGSDWYNTVTGEKFYQKANGVWISYTATTTPPIDGGDSPVMFADYATQTFLPNAPTYYNGPLNDGVGATLTSGSDGKLYGIVGSALQPLLYGQTLLVKDENPGDFESGMPSNRPHNGVYILTSEGSYNVIGVPNSPWVLTRVDYANEPNELYPSQVNILSGVNENRFFLQKNVIDVVGTEEVEYEINYVPPTQVITMPLVHMDTVTSAPLPSCTYVDEFPPPTPGGIFTLNPTTSYLTATVNGPLGVINGVNVSNSFTAPNRKILVKDQVDNKQNGDYEIIQNGSASQPWKLRRITTTYSSLNKNTREWKINNEESTLYGNRYYMNYYTPSVSIIGTTPITFSELVAGGIQNLQDVTDIGNTTTNNIQLGTGAGLLFNNGSKVKEGITDAGLGGYKGVALVCSIDYELKWEAGRLYVMQQDGLTIREVSHNFTNVPTVYDDITKGFIVGSRWLLDDSTLYICTDNTDDGAVWELQIAGNQSLQDVIDVNKVADRVEFKFVPFKGSAFTGGYDYLIDFTESNQDDGVYIYGDFAQYGTGTGQDIIKINSDGTTDTSFNVGTGFNNYPYNGSGKLAQTAAGKLYATGSFTTYNGITVNRIVRLNTDGSIDSSFVTGSGFYGGLDYTNSIGLDSLERVYVAGGCLNYNGTSIPTFARLLSDGTLDPTFVMGSGFSNTTTVILVNSDDTLFVGGHFGTYNGVSSPRLVKLLSDGSIDTSFVIGTGFNNIVTGIVKTLDNKILVTGLFTTYQGVAASKIIKLNLDGSIDTSFVVGTGFTTEPYMVKVLQDGNYLITANGTYRGITSTGFLIVNSLGFPILSPALSGYSYTGSTQLADGRIIGMSNTGATDNYLVQIVNGLPIKDQKLTFSEVTGKAEYTIDTLDGTTTYELLPKHLIQQLVTDSLPAVITPTLQEVTYAGNATTDVIVSSLGFETTLLNISSNQMAFMGISSLNQGGGIITYKGLLSLQAGSLDGTGFMSNLTSDNLTQDRFLKLPNKNGTLAITTDILPVDANPVNGSNNPVSSNGTFDALALKADLVAGKVPSSQLPSYVDDVIEGYYSAPTFYSDAGLTTAIVPETGKIYVDLLGNKSYRWSGSVYIQISNAISSIDELTDVTVTSPLNGQLLQYNLTTSQWENKTIVVGTGDMQTSTYDIDNDGIVDFAETVPVTVRNPSVSDILRKGTIVYLNGSTGYRPNAYKAQANAEATSSGTFGVVLADIATNSDGSVAMLGTIHTLDTRNAATGAPYPFTNDILLDGDVLWLDPANAGYVTKTKPQAPNHAVFIGVVARTHPSLGRIVYRITNGYELDELHNVFINGTLANNHVLYYDAATSLWKTKTIAGVLGYTPQAALTVTTVGTSGPATLSGGTLNIPEYSGGGGGSVDINIINATKLTLMYNT